MSSISGLAGSPDAEGSGSKSKVSQRPTFSCSECARRKTKCNKVIPCSSCIKRGKSHICKVDPGGKAKDRDSNSFSQAPPAMPTDFGGLCTAAFEEIETFRTHLQGLGARLGGIETMLNSIVSMHSASQPPPPPEHTYYPPQPFPGYHPAMRDPHQLDHALIKDSPRPDSAGRGSMESDDLRGEEVEASVALEFMALGRHRAIGQDSDHAANQSRPPNDHMLVYPGTNAPPTPISLFPTPASLEAVIPPRHADMFISKALGVANWHAGPVHAPTFMQELDQFWSWGTMRVTVANPSWLSLFWALMVVGVRNLSSAEREQLGYSDQDISALSRRFLDCSLACIYRGNFLEEHSMYLLQTIAVLVVQAQDSTYSNLFPTLLSSGISIAQDMGLHRMSSDAAWETSMRMAPPATRTKALIDRETRKRCFWALAVQDWFSIPYRRTYTIHPAQVTTPQPLNLRDSDLTEGRSEPRPLSEYTEAGIVLVWIKVSRCLQTVFDHLMSTQSMSYQFLLKADAEFNEIIENAPAWLKPGGPTDGMHPDSIEVMRMTFRISAHHKVVTLHRPFLARAFKDSRYDFSRVRAITASRAILREATSLPERSPWTICYHQSAAACVVCLDLFQRIRTTQQTLDEEREEVRGAQRALEKMQYFSPISARGAALIAKLLDEEARTVKNLPLPKVESDIDVNGGQPRQGSNKRPRGTEEDYSVVAKKVAGAAGLSPGASSTGSSTALPPPSTSTRPSMTERRASSPQFNIFGTVVPGMSGYPPPGPYGGFGGGDLAGSGGGQQPYNFPALSATAEESGLPPELLEMFSDFDPLTLVS